MTETESNAASASGGNGIDSSRIFRSEAFVSKVDLRVDLANHIQRYVNDDERIQLREKSVLSRGDFAEQCSNREQKVKGNYTRHVEEDDMIALQQGLIREEVRGGVEVNASLESEAIIGGAYAGTFAGPFLRTSAWADFLCWGGWVEADATRTEIASLMIRSMTFYAHVAGARVTCAYNLMDDFVLRMENFGVFTDNQTTVVHAGSPGSGIDMET